MDMFFKKVNQKVNLGRRPMPDTRRLPARPDIAILKDGFFKNPSNKQTTD